MMRNDEVGPAGNRLGGAGRRHGQTGHDALDGGRPLAQKQTDIVPIGGEMTRREAIQEIHNGCDSEHRSFQTTPRSHREHKEENTEKRKKVKQNADPSVGELFFLLCSFLCFSLCSLWLWG